MKTRIAIVDDDALIRDTVCEFMSAQGFEAQGLDGGAALRSLFEDSPPDVVILDLIMPGEDGLSVLRWLRSVSDVAVIMLTSNDATTDRVVGLELGADDYVAKPADLRELLARVRSVLRRRQSAPTPAAPTASTSSGTQLDCEAFSEQVKDALSAFHETHSLQNNKLLDSAIVKTRRTGDDTPVAALRQLIREANQRLADNPKTERAARVIHRSYIEPARSQQLAADALGMGYSTYRRHLASARDLIAAELWQQEKAKRG